MFINIFYNFTILYNVKILSYSKEEKGMNLKKVVSVLCVSALVLTVPAKPVFAKNYTDTAFELGVDFNTRIPITPAREKQDASSTYVYFQSGPSRGVNFMVFGKTGPDTYQNDTKKTAIIYPGTKRFIHQFVYERGRRWCSLGTTATSETGVARGLWSPDSIGNYPVANP